MSWTSNDGLHEGWVCPEFIDGARGIGVSGGSIPSDHVAIAVTYPSSEPVYETRPAAEVIGWRVVCNCETDNEQRRDNQHHWTSDLITRVPSTSLEDPTAGRIFADDDEVLDIDDIHSSVLQQRWLREHMQPLDALARIESARTHIAALNSELAGAVSDARAAGQSWQAIGRAAGMSRQSAHDRWSKT